MQTFSAIKRNGLIPKLQMGELGPVGLAQLLQSLISEPAALQTNLLQILESALCQLFWTHLAVVQLQAFKKSYAAGQQRRSDAGGDIVEQDRCQETAVLLYQLAEELAELGTMAILGLERQDDEK